MTQELFYTSAPRGLQPGSTGFCTVAETRGLSSLLRERLEDLSGYRELFPPHDARAGQNPIAWSNTRLTIQGKTVSVLSRVGAAGIDHSQRTNKFAHHVVVDAGEQNQAGPAALLARPGFMDSVWDGKVRTLPTGRPVPAFDVRPAPCTAWQRAAGDAGWAGAFVEAFLSNRTAYLLYPPGMDILPLIVEAVALLPADRRWQATFSTYFTAVPSGSSCAWRCVPLESPGAAEAMRAPAALVLRLDTAPGPAPAGAAIDAARAGQLVPVGPVGPQPVAAPPSVRTPLAREQIARHNPAVAQAPKQEPAEQAAAIVADTVAYLETPPPPLVRPRSSLFAGFPAGLAVGVLGTILLGVGLWLGAGLRGGEAPPPAVVDDGREAESARKLGEARKQWEEKDLPLAVERGRKEKSEELRKDVLVGRTCREVLPGLVGDLDAAILEDPAALKKTLTARLDALKLAQEDRKAAKNAKELLPQIFPTFDISTLADSARFKDELERVRGKIRDNAVKDVAKEQNDVLTRTLSLVHFYFGFDEKDVRGKTQKQLEEDAQTRYVELLKKEGSIESELESGNKARDSYKKFLHARMENWRDSVKMRVRSEATLRQEAEETRKRVGLEKRVDKNDPLLARSTTFDYITTWIVDYFDALDHYDFVLKNSRREELRNRAQQRRAEVVEMRRNAVEELDKYLKSPPK